MSMALTRHIVIAAWRNMAGNRLLSAISIFGLVIGIAAALLMAAVIRNQLSFDHFISGYERTYIAIARDNPQFTKPAPCAVIPYCQRGMTELAPKLKLAAPEIEAIARLSYTESFIGDAPLTLQAGNVTGQEMLYWADPSVFNVLPLPALHGDLSTALSRPDGIVLPRAMARRYFGHDDVVGQTILLDGHPMIVRAVIQDLPVNGTTLMSGIFAAGTAAFSPIAPNRPVGPPVYTYLRLKPGTSVTAIENSITRMTEAAMASFAPLPNQPRNLILGKLLAVDQANLDEVNNPGIHNRLAAASVAGLMVLLIALLNFVNLTMARSGRREIDVSVRKACGANRAALIVQFMGEGVLAVLLAMILALALDEWLMPALNAFLRTGAHLHDPLLPWLLAGVLASGLVSGAWPALVLSAFRPANTLRGWRVGGSAGLIRNALVTLQFAMLLVLTIAATVVWQQRDYATHEALKVNLGNVLLVQNNPQSDPTRSRPMDMHSPDACPAAFRNIVRGLPGVRDIRCTSRAFLRANSSFGWFTGGGSLKSFGVNRVDPGVLQLYDIKPLAGTLADASGVILNLAAVKFLGFASPQAALGHSWIDAAKGMSPADKRDYTSRYGVHSRITAVVPDFAFTPVTDDIRPTAFSAWLDGQPTRVIHIKLVGNHVSETLAAIDRAWSVSGQPGGINRVFMADYIAQLYQDVTREAQFFSVFAFIAILLACLGLFGVAISSAESRTKEVGVRKAMGADNRQIVAMLLWQFAQPVLWANVVAWPAAWWLMRRWLSGFAYHVDLHWWVFAAASLGALAIALATVAGQAWITARQKPVLALRYE